MLEVKNLRTNYGNIEVLKDISFSAEKGTVTSVVGANGAGKSTLLKTLSGLIKPSSGEIWFDGRRIDNLSPSQIVSLGIRYSPERAPIFPQMNVMENILVGGYVLEQHGVDLTRYLEQVFQSFPVLRERRNQKAGTLSGGERQMLSIARAMMSDPKLIMLDEPSLGLAPIVVQELGRIIAQIASQGVEVLLVEQNYWLARQLSSWLCVIELGEIVLQGSPDELKGNERIQKAYLG